MHVIRRFASVRPRILTLLFACWVGACRQVETAATTPSASRAVALAPATPVPTFIRVSGTVEVVGRQAVIRPAVEWMPKAASATYPGYSRIFGWVVSPNAGYPCSATSIDDGTLFETEESFPFGKWYANEEGRAYTLPYSVGQVVLLVDTQVQVGGDVRHVWNLATCPISASKPLQSVEFASVLALDQAIQSFAADGVISIREIQSTGTIRFKPPPDDDDDGVVEYDTRYVAPKPKLHRNHVVGRPGGFLWLGKVRVDAWYIDEDGYLLRASKQPVIGPKDVDFGPDLYLYPGGKNDFFAMPATAIAVFPVMQIDLLQDPAHPTPKPLLFTQLDFDLIGVARCSVTCLRSELEKVGQEYEYVVDMQRLGLFDAKRSASD
ncbi:MAG: hypothetical protein K8S98_10755 [Planctomycetes bacterium]|nr:hypothetical protein [Planctomycetota bacterium]